MTASLALTAFLITAFIACDKTIPDERGLYNLDVKLHSIETTKIDSKTSDFGFIKFRQDPNVPLTITLDTWVFNLTPNHDYLLQRAVNPITDNDCTSTVLAYIGQGSGFSTYSHGWLRKWNGKFISQCTSLIGRNNISHPFPDHRRSFFGHHIDE